MDPPDVPQAGQLIQFHLQIIAGLTAVYLGLRWMRTISRSRPPKSAEKAIHELLRGPPISMYLAWGIVFLGGALIVLAFVL